MIRRPPRSSLLPYTTVFRAHPVQRVGQQEVEHLVAPVVEDERAPVWVRAAAPVLVLVERRAVEARQREVVAREVRRDTVEDHRSEEHTSELQSRQYLVCRLL